MACRVGIGSDNDVSGPDVAVLRQDLVANSSDVSPNVMELADPCAATNSRTFFWFVAVFGDSAGTRWSKMIATFDGSQIFG